MATLYEMQMNGMAGGEKNHSLPLAAAFGLKDAKGIIPKNPGGIFTMEVDMFGLNRATGIGKLWQSGAPKAAEFKTSGPDLT